MKWKRKKGLVGLCRLMLLLWLLGAVLCGCGMGQGSVPDLCGRDFTADVTWQREGISLRARISVDAGEDLRMEAVFSEPKTMEGLRVV
ncbi:MAG: hypothetical protein IJY42_02465, partial [Clostridia bacterium]|nr:hypothetical protein [Clostridia bacterium]